MLHLRAPGFCPSYLRGSTSSIGTGNRPDQVPDLCHEACYVCPFYGVTPTSVICP
jgi:hypothetical protein